MAKVYALLDDRGCIKQMGSDVFLIDLAGWTQIDEGTGDRFSHAQSQYLEGPPTDDYGVPLYRWDGAQVVARSAEDLAADRAALPTPPITETVLLRAQIQALSDRNDFLEDCVAEMATIIYA